MEQNKGKIGFLAGVDKCRFKRQVKPGDQLELTVEIIRMKDQSAKEKVLQPSMEKLHVKQKLHLRLNKEKCNKFLNEYYKKCMIPLFWENLISSNRLF